MDDAITELYTRYIPNVVEDVDPLEGFSKYTRNKVKEDILRRLNGLEYVARIETSENPSRDVLFDGEVRNSTMEVDQLPSSTVVNELQIDNMVSYKVIMYSCSQGCSKPRSLNSSVEFMLRGIINYQ